MNMYEEEDDVFKVDDYNFHLKMILKNKAPAQRNYILEENRDILVTEMLRILDIAEDSLEYIDPNDLKSLIKSHIRNSNIDMVLEK